MYKPVGRVVAGLLCVLPLTAPAAAPGEAAKVEAAKVEGATVEGVWVRHDRQFSYMGVTSHYSCDGLEYKLKSLLRIVGARDDLVVRASCSDPMGGPSRIATAHMTYYTLALPGAAASGDATPNVGHPAKPLKVEPPVPGVGQWKAVELRATHLHDIQEGDCELVDQFDREILADFTVRNHESHFTCIPHQMSMNGIRSNFEVLAPLPKPAAPKAASKG